MDCLVFDLLSTSTEWSVIALPLFEVIVTAIEVVLGEDFLTLFLMNQTVQYQEIS